MTAIHQSIKEAYMGYLSGKDVPCVAAKAAVARQHIQCIVSPNMACPAGDQEILEFLYSFVDVYRNDPSPFHSAAVIFETPAIVSEETFEELFWQRLQSFSDLDAKEYVSDPAVSADPQSAEFSFSIKSEAFFILGLHPLNRRAARRFTYPAIVFNPHAEFERMRTTGTFEKMKNIIRKRDILYSGSVNPMLDDFGNSSEVYQYSGSNYAPSWQCPLKNNHGTTEDNSAA